MARALRARVVALFGRGTVGLAMLGALGLLGGCVAQSRAQVVKAPPPLSPFDETPVSFAVPTSHFDRGELAMVWVCIGADGNITSAQLLESSGDSRFDALALRWARQVRLRSIPVGAVRAPCGAVRVEVRRPEMPRAISGADSALG